ncbi:MAG: hypothetical protein ACRENJ_07075 [Candidatus Eiseniibacteriota bacterium]
MRTTIAFLTAVGMVIPLAAQALNERVWLMVNGGAGQYAMADLNTLIDETNAANAGTGWSFARVEDGRLFGLTMGFETGGKWNFGLGCDRLSAATRASDANGALEYRFGANAWRLFGEYALRPIGQSTFFVGGAVGIIQENGKLIESTTGSAPYEYKIHGSDPSYEGHVGGNLWVTPQFGLTATVGYRYARVNEVKVEEFPIIMSNGEPMSLDFSGVSARLGIKLAAKNLSE